MAMQDAVAHVKVDSKPARLPLLEIVNRTRQERTAQSWRQSARHTHAPARRARPRHSWMARDYCTPRRFQAASRFQSFLTASFASSPPRLAAEKSETTDSVLRDIVESVPVPL